MKRDIYQDVTNQIVQAIENGPEAWARCWKSTMPANGITGRAYNGINVLLLWLAVDRGGYASSDWMTYRQAAGAGGQVKKGEKGTTVVFYKKRTITEKDESGEEVKKDVPVLKAFTVFNREQVEGLPEVEAVEVDRIEEAEAIVKGSGAMFTHGEPAYIPAKEMISMPETGAFETVENFYATTFHELTHWTGSKKRLGRDLSGRFGDASYAAEELIAEIGSAFLCAKAGIQGELRHAGYVQSWLKVLKNDKRAIFNAASHASKAAEYLADLVSEEIREAA